MKRRVGVISLYSIIDFCLLYIGISSVFPRINGSLGGLDTAICLVANVVLLIVALARIKKCFRKRIDAVLLMFFLGYSVIIPYALGNTIIANRYLGILIFLTAPCIYMYYEQSGQLNRLKQISRVVCIAAMITLVTTSVELLTNPYIARSIKTSGEITTSLKISGIGGYEFVYFCMLVGVALFHCFWQEKKPEYLVGTIVLFGFLLLSNYMTAVFLLAFGCMICLLSGKDVKQRIMAIFIIFLLIFFSHLILDNIGGMIERFSPTGRIARFINSSNDGVLGSMTSEFVYDRLPTIQASLDTISKHFELGVIFSDNAQVSMLGQHSFVLDSLAVFGIPMIIFLFDI